MPPKNTNLDKFWNAIIEGLNQIFERKNSHRSFCIQLYGNVYNYFTVDEHEDVNLTKDGKKQLERNQAKGKKLYNHLKIFMESYVTNLSLRVGNRSAEDILKFYHSEWSYYEFCIRVLNSTFLYFDQIWIKREQHDDHTKVLTIDQLALTIWTSHFVEKFADQISGAVCQLIQRERMGENISTSLILNIVDSYRRLDKNLTKHFANKFVEKAEMFYIRQGTKYLDENTLGEYVVKAHQWLEEERQRANLYFCETTTKHLLKVLTKVLIKNHIELFYEEFRRLLISEKNVVLESLCSLVIKISDCGSQKVASILHEHIKCEGLLALEKCCEYAQNDPKMYVNTILQVYKKYSTLISKEFRNDSNCRTGLDKAFASFVNRNAITTMTKSSRKSSELIVKYCDTLLNKSNKISGVHELNDSLNQVIVLFQYIEDKDVFQIFYSKLLAKRLVQRLSLSDDAEIGMIVKLRETHGYDYIAKFQKMIQDVELSKDLSQDFRTYIADSKDPLDFHFDIQVLSFGSWPFQKCSPVVLPLECEKVVSRFVSFYSGKHCGKKLHWLYDMSIGELTTNGYKNKYTIIANTFQISILSQYNKSESWTIGQLTESTSIETSMVVEIVQILLKAKLVSCSEEGQNLRQDSVVRINNDYRNKKLRININVPMKVEAKVDQERTQQQIEVDRRSVTQAAIVRIMKSRKTLGHQQLIGEVLNQMERKFKPSVAVIKKCIDILIEKEYLERSTESLATYNYVS